MAKTKKVVDLKPTNISEEQLKSVQEVVSNINKAHMEIGRIESRKHNLVHGLVEFQKSLQTIQESLEKEYGTVNINIQTGEINYDVETDKKD